MCVNACMSVRMMAVRERWGESSPPFSLLDDALDVGSRQRVFALDLPTFDFLDLNPPGIAETLSCELRPAVKRGDSTDASMK